MIMKTMKVQVANLLFVILFVAVSTLFSNGVLAQESEGGFIISIQSGFMSEK
jgi:hypothetical protein